MKKFVFLGLFLMAMTGFANAQEGRKFPPIGIDVGVYFPTSSRTKDVFGSMWTSIGPGIGSAPVNRAKISPDIDFLRQDKNDNDVFAAMVGAKYLFPLCKPFEKGQEPSFAPYAGAGLKVAYADVDAPDVNVDDKGFGVGASAILGVSFNQRFFAEARYTALTRTADFNLSGGALTVGVRF